MTVTHALDMTCEEWALGAEKYTRERCDALALIPAGHPVYAWAAEAEDLGRDLAARTRAMLTARLRETEGRASGHIRDRRLVLGRYARAGEWDEVAVRIGRALQYELAGIDTSALARDLFALEKLVRDRTAAIYRLGQDLLRQAIEAEKARRTTDEAWQRELERREQIKAYLGGRWRNAGARA